MRSKAVGKNISNAEVTNISTHGIWLLVHGREYFLPYTEFPWFKEATLADIIDVTLLHGHHLHWQKLDIDLDLKSLNNIESYPLVYK